MQGCINFAYLFQVCSTPLTKNGLTYNTETQQIPNTWVVGDEILYRCTGSGLISSNVTNKCQNNGQWSLPSLQSLPLCCKLK